MNVLVTGGSGLVGRHLKDIEPNYFYVSSEYDLLNTYSIDSMFDKYSPDVVVHLAARVGGIVDNITNPVDYYDTSFSTDFVETLPNFHRFYSFTKKNDDHNTQIV